MRPSSPGPHLAPLAALILSSSRAAPWGTAFEIPYDKSSGSTDDGRRRTMPGDTGPARSSHTSHPPSSSEVGRGSGMLDCRLPRTSEKGGDRQREEEGGRENFCSFSDHHPFVIFSSLPEQVSSVSRYVYLCLFVIYLPFQKPWIKHRAKCLPFLSESREKSSHRSGTHFQVLFSSAISPPIIAIETPNPLSSFCACGQTSLSHPLGWTSSRLRAGTACVSA